MEQTPAAKAAEREFEMDRPDLARQSRRRFLQNTSAAMLGAAAMPVWGNGGSRRINLIVLVTDDHRWDCLGCMGHPILRTPNLDRLANDGVLFTNHFCTTSICMTSRATIFTGLYSRCHTIHSFNLSLPESLFPMSYPMALRSAGYRTGFIGKWGLGGDLPEKDFDYFKGFPGQGKYFHEINGQRVHLTRIMADQAEEFVQGCSPNQPFCLSVSFKSPHVQDGGFPPFQFDRALADFYEDEQIPVPRTATEAHFEALPEFIRISEGRVRWGHRFATPEMYQESVKDYLRLITGVDRAVGQILECLKRRGALDNTAILFTSDNGFFLGEHGLAGKWLMHEESIRVPMILWHPCLPQSRRGQSIDKMTLNIDIAPTILDLAGLEIPPWMQGRSLMPLASGDPAPWREEWFYEHLFKHPTIPKNEGVRTERWKYIRYIAQDPICEELYDLDNDPVEEHNLVGSISHCQILDRLRTRRKKWIQSLENWRLDSPVPWQEPV